MIYRKGEIKMGYYVGVPKKYVPNARSIYNNAGFKVEVFPYTKKGLTQDKWSKLRITNQSRSMLDKAKNSRKLRESVIGKYIETW